MRVCRLSAHVYTWTCMFVCRFTCKAYPDMQKYMLIFASIWTPASTRSSETSGGARQLRRRAQVEQWVKVVCVLIVGGQGYKRTDSVKNLDNIELTPWVNIPLKTPLMLLSSFVGAATAKCMTHPNSMPISQLLSTKPQVFMSKNHLPPFLSRLASH